MNRLYINKDWSTLKKLIAIKAAGGGAPMVEYTVTGNPATFETNVIAPMELLIPFSPVQDLHGQDAPYPAGAGKNLLPITGTSVKANEIQYTVVKDSDDNIVAVTAVGTATAGATFSANLSCSLKAGSYVLNGCPASGASSGKWRIRLGNSSDSFIGNDTGSGYSFTLDSDTTVSVKLVVELVGTAVDLTFYPMIRLSTETDATYAPYSNICLISGWDSANITGTGKNLFDPSMILSGNYFIRGDSGGRDATSSTPEFRSTDYIYCKMWQGKTIILNHGPRGTVPGIAYYDANKDFISGVQNNGLEAGTERKYIIPDNAYYLRFTTLVDYVNVLQLEEGTSATAYEPFGETHPIPFPSTVYGGNVKVNKDGSRKLVADKVKTVVSGLTTSNIKYSTNTKTFYTDGINVTPGILAKNFTDAFVGFSDKFEAYPGDSVVSWANATKCYIGYINSTTQSVRFSITGKTSVAQDVVDILNGTEIVYELATPVEIDLTDSDAIVSMLGVNNVWSDTNGENTVKYMKKG